MNHIRKTFLPLIFITSAATFADDNRSLQVEPEKCVTLQQGRTCYLDVTVHWKNEVKGDFCLVQESVLEPLKCWNDSDNGALEFEFSSDRTLSLHLIELPGQHVIDSTEIAVKWVYKSRQKASIWRIF
jgi:hypothetical protein